MDCKLYISDFYYIQLKAKHNFFYVELALCLTADEPNYIWTENFHRITGCHFLLRCLNVCSQIPYNLCNN